MPTLEDRTVGALLGTALGDAFGSPFKGASPESLRQELFVRAARPRPWRYTDDTQMTIAIARSLASGGDLEPEMLLAKLAGSYDSTRGYTICAMTFALAGCLGGRSALPALWLCNLQHERPALTRLKRLRWA
jgi:ADP-ribosylglycohydrolase